MNHTFYFFKYFSKYFIFFVDIHNAVIYWCVLCWCVLIILLTGNKLSKKHIEWEKNKIKVKLAVQVLSTSTANSLAFCKDDLGMKEFENADGTIKFCKTFDIATDILNSRSAFSRGQKAPLAKKMKWNGANKSTKYRNTLWDLKPRMEKP